MSVDVEVDTMQTQTEDATVNVGQPGEYYHVSPDEATLRDFAVVIMDDDVPVLVVYEYPEVEEGESQRRRAEWFDLSEVCVSDHPWVDDDGVHPEGPPVQVEDCGVIHEVCIRGIARGSVFVDYYESGVHPSPRLGVHSTVGEDADYMISLSDD